MGVAELVGGVAFERDVSSLAADPAQAKTGSFLVTVTQPCDDRRSRPRMRPGSWLFIRDGGLVAFDLLVYEADCAIAGEWVLASDHDALRVVGEQLFRRLGRGRFRYGSLQYEFWDDAFAAPTREATLSLLRADAAANPDDGETHNRLAVALHASGDREAAFDRLRRAARLDPTLPCVHWNLASLHRQRGEKGEAAREEAIAEGAGGSP